MTPPGEEQQRVLQEIKLLFQMEDGRLCPILRARLAKGSVPGFIEAVYQLSRYVPNLKVAVNDHVVTGMESFPDGVHLRGIHLEASR